MAFFLETLIGGLFTGVLYALVALGFVLIFKASGVFNFAQGAMVLFAALSVARLSEVMPLVFAVALAIVIMIALAYAIEFLVLRHLINQDGIILFMATLGIAYFLEGFGQTVWGSDVYIDERTVDVHVGRLRKALNRGQVDDPIRTVRGAGYALDDRFGKTA